MSNIKVIAEKLTLKLAQMTSSQAADIQDTLASAGLWNLGNDVAAMLNKSAVPEASTVQINIIVDKGLNVHFDVKLTPPHGSATTLARLLQNTYSAKMKQALVNAKLSVVNNILVKWLTF